MARADRTSRHCCWTVELNVKDGRVGISSVVKLTVGVSCNKPDVGTVIVNGLLVTVKSANGDPVISVP